jgi:hypothetical protein
MARLALLLCLLLTLPLVVAGCGGDDEDEGSGSTTPAEVARTQTAEADTAETEFEAPGTEANTVEKRSPAPKKGSGDGGGRAPDDPEPSDGGTGAPSAAQRAAARDAGAKACRGKSPREVRDRYFDEAKGDADLRPGSALRRLDDALAEQPEGTPYPPAIGAAVYAITQPEPLREPAARGCLSALGGLPDPQS